ncbi:hypothetical protein BDR05DRAFT_1000650 [Suillus weaverae]|nr:hypothetical protein BDR05DRAFT_1000650 [Suillus weaverae]
MSGGAPCPLAPTLVFVNSIRRVDAQFYTHDVRAAWVCDPIPWQDVFHGAEYHKLSLIPALDFADHISGNFFYIRSKVSPYEYWYYPPPPNKPTNAVYVSRTERTCPHVSRTDSGTTRTVMIGSDGIVITLTAVNLSINVIAGTGQVIVSPAPQVGLKLSDLWNKFTVRPTLCEDGERLDMKELFYTDYGSEWELV